MPHTRAPSTDTRRHGRRWFRVAPRPALARERSVLARRRRRLDADPVVLRRRRQNRRAGIVPGVGPGAHDFVSRHAGTPDRGPGRARGPRRRAVEAAAAAGDRAGFSGLSDLVDLDPSDRYGRAAAAVHAGRARRRERARGTGQAAARGRAQAAGISGLFAHLRHAQPDRQRLAGAPHPCAREIFLLPAGLFPQQRATAGPVHAAAAHRRAGVEPGAGGAGSGGRCERSA